jgi:hypothetical protein
MTTERDPGTRIVLSWLREDAHENAERLLLRALDEVDATPQRRSWWPARRFALMNIYAKAAIAAAAVLVVAVVGYQLLPPIVGPGGGQSPTPTPQSTAVPLADGSFVSHGAQIELHAAGEGSNVTGSMTAVDVPGDSQGRITVELACTRTTGSGLILIGGTVTDSVNYADWAPKGGRVAIILQRGSPVNAIIHSESGTAHATCTAFLGSIPDVGDPGFESNALEPIEGTVTLRP